MGKCTTDKNVCKSPHVGLVCTCRQTRPHGGTRLTWSPAWESFIFMSSSRTPKKGHQNHPCLASRGAESSWVASAHVRSNQKNSCARIQSLTCLKDLSLRTANNNASAPARHDKTVTCLEAQTSKEFVPPIKAPLWFSYCFMLMTGRDTFGYFLVLASDMLMLKCFFFSLLWKAFSEKHRLPRCAVTRETRSVMPVRHEHQERDWSHNRKNKWQRLARGWNVPPRCYSHIKLWQGHRWSQWDVCF